MEYILDHHIESRWALKHKAEQDNSLVVSAAVKDLVGLDLLTQHMAPQLGQLGYPEHHNLSAIDVDAVGIGVEISPEVLNQGVSVARKKIFKRSLVGR